MRFHRCAAGTIEALDSAAHSLSEGRFLRGRGSWGIFRIFFRQLGEIPEMLQILVAKRAAEREREETQVVVVSPKVGNYT